METISGVLRIIGNESRVNDMPLARCGDSSPFSAATGFLGNLQLRDGDNVTISGNSSTIGGVAVFCMNDASRS
ncbi:MAG TPA: hypothetical protein VEU30_05825 [Thermoanaerobaculia bacterium]|nr:hypothetical protein [Thermoanaerobaculia bacterium]